MKKKIFLVSALVVMAMSAMFIACSKNEPSEPQEAVDGCSCTFRYGGEVMGKQYFSLSDMKSGYGVSTCSGLAKALNGEAPDYTITCN